ncbi:MAG: murein peptide amidase A, partial [Bdellovibrionales bacterium]|nr:murein peptide amidase A [Bdellovibrionales bacterium]
WSTEYKEPRYFPGTHPSSEPETESLVQLIAEVRPRLIIHCHSWHPSIVVSGPEGLVEAEALSTASGYKLSFDIGYPTPGSLGEYAWKDLGIPVICIEEQEHIDLKLVWPHFSKAMEFIFFRPTEGEKSF